MTTIKYTEDARCPCGGQYAYDASITQKLPLGLGFAPGGTKFQIDVLERKGWRGECMDCNKKVFAVVSERHKTKYPAGINRKLRLAQAA